MNDAPLPEPSNQTQIKFWKRFLFCVVAWVLALVASCPSLSGIRFLRMFPAGIYRVFTPWHGVSVAYLNSAWVAYLLATVLPLLASRRVRFWTFYSVLAFLLCCNAVGCQMIFHSMSGIH